ncbi:hypothetical protein [Phaeobacter phage MD18]|nr:hypothetical protein [Phaeobacter phage MD18]
MATPDWETIDPGWVREKLEEIKGDPDYFRKNFRTNPFIPEIFPLEVKNSVANRHFNWHSDVTETDTAADAAQSKEIYPDG